MYKSILVLFFVALAVNCATICDTYSAGNGSALISAVVDATVGLALDPANNIKKYFDGTIAGSTNFTGNAVAYAGLRTNLISFFGSALGCSDGSIPAYTGGDITKFHTALNIDFPAYFTFNNALLSVLVSSKVAAADVTAVATVLDTLRANCCTNALDCFSICNKLITPGLLNASALITSVVNATVNAAVASPILLPYFTGAIGNHGDFTGARLPTLFQHLIQFFGGALGCSDGTIGKYTGQSLLDAHAGMNVSLLAFNTFNAALMGVIGTAIAPGTPDYNAIYTLLNGTKDQVCTAPDCGTVSTSGASSSGASSSKSASASSSGASSSGASSSKSSSGASSSGASSSSTSSSATPAPTPSSSTGFGLVLVAPIFTLLSAFLF